MDKDCSPVSLDEPNPQKQRVCCYGSEADRISALHDELLIKILSLLPIQYAVPTSVLSRRWSNLWTFITDFRFDSSTICKPLENVSNINHILSQFQSPQIRSFNINFSPPRDSDSDKPDVESWLRLICSRKVQYIDISMLSDSRLKTVIHLPSCLFESKSLVTLDLNVDLFSVALPEVASLPNLKSLFVSKICDPSHYSFFCKLVNESCPRLVGLSMFGSVSEPIHIAISSHVLRMLCLCFWNTKYISGAGFTRVYVDAPNLIRFHATYSSHLVMFEFPKEPKNVLRKAYLKYNSHKDDCSMEVFRRICSVWELKLDYHVMDAITRLDDDSQLPNFSNLILFKCNILFSGCWKALLRFLHRAANLKFLVIKILKNSKSTNRRSSVPIDYSTPPCSLQHIKRIRIHLRGIPVDNEMELIKFLLCNATALEKLTVKVLISRCESNEFQQQKESELLEILSELLPSSSCQIQVTCYRLTG